MGRILVALVVIGLGFGSPAAAEIYQWTDAQGRTHFTDRLEDVPAAHRRDIRPELTRSGRVNVIEGLNPAPAPRVAVPTEGAGDDVALDWTELASLGGGGNGAPVGPGADAAAQQALGTLAGALGIGLVGVAIAVALMLVIGLAVLAFCIKVAARICSQDVPGFGRAFAIAGIQMVAGIAAGILLVLVVGFSTFQDPARAFQLQGANTALGFAVNAAVLRGMWCPTLGGALAVTLVSMLVALALGLGLGLLVALGVGGMALLGA